MSDLQHEFRTLTELDQAFIEGLLSYLEAHDELVRIVATLDHSTNSEPATHAMDVAFPLEVRCVVGLPQGEHDLLHIKLALRTSAELESSGNIAMLYAGSLEEHPAHGAWGVAYGGERVAYFGVIPTTVLEAVGVRQPASAAP
jgi:hypothetical protein